MSEASRLRAIAAAAAAAAERWPMPSIDGPLVGTRRAGAESRDSKGAQAEHARGYEAGLAAGRAHMERATAELNGRVQRLDALLGMLARPLAELDAAVERELVLLAVAVGRQLARRELKTDPAEIIGIIREAVARLPASARDVRIQLHPEDAAIVRERLASPAQDRAWSLIEDPTQTRGGCLIRSESSQIDARVESRVNGIVGSLLGDERSRERTAEPPAPEDA